MRARRLWRQWPRAIRPVTEFASIGQRWRAGNAPGESGYPNPRYPPAVRRKRLSSSRMILMHNARISFTSVAPLALVLACGTQSPDGSADAGAADGTTIRATRAEADARPDADLTPEASAD